MYFSATVTPPPAPVGATQVSFSVRYIVVRGDGFAKVLDSLYDTKSTWMAPGTHPLCGGPGGTSQVPEILIPLDLLTALRLGLVQEHELELPEGVKALFNMIK